MNQIIYLDAGQSGSRATVATGPSPDPALTSASGPIIELPKVITDAVVVDQLADRVRAALAEFGPATAVAIGSSGLSGQVRATDLLDRLTATPVRSVWLAHDSVTNYLAVLGARPGVVVAAGTGVVTLAVGAGAVARVDGWGYLVGDAGSGYWIGRAGLDAVLRAFDGRGPATALTAVVAAEYPSLPDVYLELQRAPDKVARISRFARPVSELAHTDPACRDICLAAAAELAHSALSALLRVGLAGDPAVLFGLSGRVLDSAPISAELIRLVRVRHPDAEVVRSARGALAGAALLPGLPPGSALHARVDVAHR